VLKKYRDRPIAVDIDDEKLVIAIRQQKKNRAGKRPWALEQVILAE